MSVKLPKYTQKYFWGDDLDELSWQTHQQYIIQTLLEKGDTKSISWLMNQVSKKYLQQLLPNLKLSKKSKNFWTLYLS